jgi:DNA-binding transcriptional ArsR family regulator
VSAAEPRLARVAAAIADPTRARTLARLLDGRLHTAGELAALAGVTPATMSAHLKLLLEEGLTRLRVQGWHRYYGLADGNVAHALEALMQVADSAEPAELRRWQRPAMRGLRHARSCYGHLAGELGVRLHDALLRRGWVQPREPDGREFGLSETGRAALAALGPGFAAALAADGSRRALYDCVDWSERRDHFAGAVAAELLTAFIAQGWLAPREGTRELSLTPPGRTALMQGLLQET